MQSLPDLKLLTDAQKDDLIRSLFACLEESRTQVAELTLEVTELKARLALDSRNSSKPPSTDGYGKPKPKSLRVPGQNPTGGQIGHPGHTLKRSEHPDRIVSHATPARCTVCGLSLPPGTVVETRQVFDLPSLRYEVTEHQVLESRCTCGQSHRSEFPAEVKAPVQYGPRVKAAVVHLSQHHMLPAQRTAQVLGDLCDLPLSDATVLSAVSEASAQVEPVVEVIAERLVATPVVHADETGLRVAGKLHWLHGLATDHLTWLGLHPKRGKEAFAAFGLLEGFHNTLIHDGWKPYRELNCVHGLCNAHHLRELTYLFEEMNQAWAKRLMDLLVETCHEVNTAGGSLTPDRIGAIRSVYWEILCEGEASHPRAPPSGKRGRTRQSKAVNLLQRLRDYADDVLRFMVDPSVPFTNNVAERAVRMPKVKQKVSGCFRTVVGARAFCTIRSYLDTVRKQGGNPFLALVQTFEGKVPPLHLT
jgi:transposase